MKLTATLVTVAVLAASLNAHAHGELVTTSPEDGAVKKKAPDHVMINLTETPSERAFVKVTDGCNNDVVEKIYTQQQTLHVLLEKGSPGNWVVDYKVISKEDGHKTASAFSFAVKGQVDCSAPSDPEEPNSKDPTGADTETVAPDSGPDASGPTGEDSSLPLVPIAIGTLVLLAVAFALRNASSK